MTVEPSYRIDLLAAKGEDDFGVAQDMEDWLTEHGVLVSDTRLQAIADAWNTYRDVPYDCAEIKVTYYVKATALLDALIKENDD